MGFTLYARFLLALQEHISDIKSDEMISIFFGRAKVLLIFL